MTSNSNKCGRGFRNVVFVEILGETQQRPSDKLPQKNSLSLNAPNESVPAAKPNLEHKALGDFYSAEQTFGESIL